MNEPKDQNEAACGGSALTAELGAETPRVEALIARVMEKHQRLHALDKYYEEVHQHLAPLARELERENVRLRYALKDIATSFYSAPEVLRQKAALAAEAPNV